MKAEEIATIAQTFGLSFLAWPPSAGDFLSTAPILTATAGLIAFNIGLYTLVGRERKSPYIINTVFALFLLCLANAAIAITASFFKDPLRGYLLWASGIILVFAFIFSFYKVYRITVRFVYFVDSVHLKHLPIIRNIRRINELWTVGPTYKHNTIPIPKALKDEIVQLLSRFEGGAFDKREGLDPQSLAVAALHQGQSNQLLAQLSECFLNAGFSVQYLTASRHPIEFVGYLNRYMKDNGTTDWQSKARHFVVIDAYSSHFAFIDSIYPKKDRELPSLNVTRIASKATFAGIHSSASRAFNKLREQVEGEDRKPTLVIYEDTYALSDLESPEQYRIFVRHVMPSERLWDGMFTVFIESTQSDGDWKLLQSYASMTLDLRQRSGLVEKSIPCNTGASSNGTARPQSQEPEAEER